MFVRLKELVRSHPWIVPMGIFACMVTVGARLHPLWGDEAETGLLAKNIVKFGYPVGWDGVNIMGSANAIVLNSKLVAWSVPWPQLYLAAISFLLFGVSSFSARLPFILISVTTIPLTYLVARKYTNVSVATLSTWILSVSVPYILFAYQARYYALTVFFGLLFWYAGISISENKKWPKYLFIASAAGFLFSNFLTFPVLWVSIFTANSYLVFKTKVIAFRTWIFRYVALSVIPLGIFAVWWRLVTPNRNQHVFDLPTADLIWDKARYLLTTTPTNINRSNIFPEIFLLIIPVTLFIYKRRKRSSVRIRYLLILGAVYFFALAVTDGVFGIFADIFPSETRYNVLLFPLLTVAVAALLDSLKYIHKSIFIIIFVLFIGSTVFTLTSPLKSFLWLYAEEIFHPYQTPQETVAAYLNSHATDSQTVFLNIDEAHDPLIFLLKKDLLFVNRVTPDNPWLFPANIHILPSYIYKYYTAPDWIVLYGLHGQNGTILTNGYRGFYPRGLLPDVSVNRDYEQVAILPVFFYDLTRPEIGMHQFQPLNARTADYIYIYRKKV